MGDLLHNIKIPVNSNTYLKDPESSDLGRKIIEGSVVLMDEIGFEDFTFKKLGEHIGSTEASIYRYFESKHKLLRYLINWYWAWVEYKLVFKTTNIESAHERLKRAILILTEHVKQDSNFLHINEVLLNRIVINDSSKTYLTKEVDKENEAGIYKAYKNLVARVADIITEINPAFKYPNMLVSTVIEGAHVQRYFALHLPKLTDCVHGEDAITEFYTHMVFQAIKNV